MTITITVGTLGDEPTWQDAEDTLGVLTDNTVVAQLNEALTIAAQVSWNGITVGAFSLTATADSGASFVDQMDPLTDPLTFNSSLGASLTATAFMSGMMDFVDCVATVSRLQFSFSNGVYDKQLVRMRQNGSAIDQMMILAAASTTGANAYILWLTGQTSVQRSLLIGQGNYTAINGAATSVLNVGMVNTAGGSGKTGLEAVYANPVVKNSYAIGFGTDFSGTADAGSSNNATSAGSFSGTNYGGSGQVSAVAATEFESATGAGDWRLKSTSAKLRANGTASGTPGTDIFGNAWNSGTPDISPIRFAGSAPANNWVPPPPQLFAKQPRRAVGY